MDEINLFKGKTVLITGGTGFLGKRLVKEILRYEPHSIRIYSRDEVKHHKVQELFKHEKKLRHLIGDVRDYPRLKKACEGADILIHAAALKRLDLLEYNVAESIKTNIIGTLNIVDACLECDVEKAILISSDKACSPVNTYGACKFVSERIFTESNFNKGNKKTIFTVVRYGNVLESTGSVIPFFESKIKEGAKIPLTDPHMTRFIISPEQAVNLVINASKYCRGGEVFVPKLPALMIIDLIEILKEKHKANNEIEKIGIRPGEKIHELMINTSEIPRTYEFRDMYVITSQIEKYSSKGGYPYLDESNRLNIESMGEYNSKEAVISKEKVAELLKKLKLI